MGELCIVIGDVLIAFIRLVASSAGSRRDEVFIEVQPRRVR